MEGLSELKKKDTSVIQGIPGNFGALSQGLKQSLSNVNVSKIRIMLQGYKFSPIKQKQAGGCLNAGGRGN